MPHVVEEQLLAIKGKWPEIKTFNLHLHNGRGMAIASAYTAIATLGADDVIELDGSIGGIGGCPYCGNGRATGMMPTEDAIHMFEQMGIDTKINVDKIIKQVATANIVGLNCGRWDYIFSFIKKFRNNKDFILPDRSLVSMRVHFMKAYSELLIQTCHKRRAHAIGGMAAQIPIKNDEEKNKKSLQKVYDDKLIEVYNGHDGTWVAHPALVSIAKEVFDNHLEYPCQLGNKREDIHVTSSDLLKLPVKTAGGRNGVITEAGIRTNINVGILYIEAWLRGNGCVPLYNLMEAVSYTHLTLPTKA